uniref:Ig-like domain-containing protein n=1 Tax=Cyanistes caeruleus TaxID=156563 RepID=A0A8C0U5V0_CYACU
MGGGGAGWSWGLWTEGGVTAVSILCLLAPSDTLRVLEGWGRFWGALEGSCQGTPVLGLGTPAALAVTHCGVPVPSAVTGPSCPPERLVLQVPAGPLLEGDTVTLRCRSRRDKTVTEVRFYHGEKDLGKSLRRSELSLSPLRLQHSGQYRCQIRWIFWPSWSPMWEQSDPVSVTVHELFPVPVLEAPAELMAGSPLNLSCLSSRSPLRPLTPLVHRFYRDGRQLGGPQGSPQLLLPALGLSGSGNYSCEVQSQGGAVRKSSAPLRVTVLGECGDGRGEPPQPARGPLPCPGPFSRPFPLAWLPLPLPSPALSPP